MFDKGNLTEQKVSNAVDAFINRHSITENIHICHRIKQCYQLPFYQWKIRNDENKQIKDLLSKADKSDFNSSTCPIYRLLFCLYVSEWIKYNHEDGHVKWDNITNDIDALKNINTTDCVTKTFSFLNRNSDIIPENYLYTLARESGFPIGLLKTPKYCRYFRSIVERKGKYNSLPAMYQDSKTQNLWREIADGFMALRYSIQTKILDGDMFRYYGIDTELYNFFKTTQRETQSHRFTIEFSLKKTEQDFKLNKKISVPKEIIIPSDSEFIEIQVAETKRSSWYDKKGGWEYTISPITPKPKQCLDPVYITIGKNRNIITDKPYNAPAGADLTHTVIYFIGDKDSESFKYHKHGYCKTELGKKMYAIYPKQYIAKTAPENNIDISPYDIFDGYKVLEISGNIDFYDGDICVGGVSDDYQDIAEYIIYKGDIFNKSNIQIGTQGHPVYKGMPSVEINGKLVEFNAHRKSATDVIRKIDNSSTLVGRQQLLHLDENQKMLASLTCILVPRDFDIDVPNRATYIDLPECVEWTDTQGQKITGLNCENKGVVKYKMHLPEQESIVITIDLDENENVFYTSNDEKLSDGDIISLYDIDNGAYVKPCITEQEIIVNNNNRRTHKIPKRKFYLSNIKHTILDEILLGYSDGANQKDAVVSIGEHYKKSIQVSPYHWKIVIEDSKDAGIYKHSKKTPYTEQLPMRFISIHNNKIHNLDGENGAYYLSSILDKGAGILFVPESDHIKPRYYQNNFEPPHDSESLQNIVLGDTKKRKEKIAQRYSQMIQNPGYYGADWSYMETLLTATDNDLPVKDMDVFKAWYNCPDIVPTLYARYVADEKMQGRIKRIITKNGFQSELISYVAYKDLYKVLSEHMEKIAQKSVTDVYGDNMDFGHIFKLYHMENGIGILPDIQQKTDQKILNLFPDNKMLHRLLCNANGKNYLNQNENLHDEIRNMYVSPIKQFEKGDTRAFADRLEKIIKSFACEHRGQVNNYTEKDFIQLHRVYNDNSQTKDVQKWSSSGKGYYDEIKTDYVDWIANDLKMTEFKKKETDDE